MLLVDRGSMYCNISEGACFFFDIDVKGGESVVISRRLQLLQWYGFQECYRYGFQGCYSGKFSCMFFKGLPSMPKGEIVGMFLDRGRVCVFLIDEKDQHDQ